ncbi:MAG: YicC/YloC family endoribonuclease [bacterium]
MTGYGEGRESSKEVDLHLEMSTVNHRFLEIEVNSSEPIPFAWEKKIRQLTREKIKRGKVNLNVEVKWKSSFLSEVAIDRELAISYKNGLSRLCQNLGLNDRITLSHLLALPGVISSSRKPRIKNNLEIVLEKALTKALKNVLKMREKEGKEHLQSILRYLERIQKRLSSLEEEIPTAQNLYQEKIKESLQNLVALGEDREKVARELSLLISRGDVSEERLRFQSHLRELQTTVQQKEPVGKKMRFILQELQREINTIGAKANSFIISRLVVQIKEDLERIREEVQNVE